MLVLSEELESSKNVRVGLSIRKGFLNKNIRSNDSSVKKYVFTLYDIGGMMDSVDETQNITKYIKVEA